MPISRHTPWSVLLSVVLWLFGSCAGPLGGWVGEGVVRAADVGAGEGLVINELHTDPDVKTDLLEFVELHNPGPADVDLSGWSFSDGIEYTFPDGAVLAAGAYAVVCQAPEQVDARWGVGRIGIPDELIFGPYGGRLDNEGERVALCNADGQVVDEVSYKLGFPWPTVGDPMSESVPGSGPSLQLVNPAFDNDLAGSWRSHLPTPVAVNEIVWAENIPPHIRQVRHVPQQPSSGEVVTITARVTDPDGVAGVTLRYQIVEPGQYISRDDPAYVSRWTAAAMRDDGLEADALAGDNVFTVLVPAAVQSHRRLVRYRIVVEDTLGNDLVVPYADDPQPNFAYFVYDGVPAWRGAVQPGITPVVEFSPEVMRSVPVYHLISKKADVEESTWLSHYGGSDYRWWGTLVYDGDVYDHIRYRARGGVWRYAMGKNMHKVDFGRGHYFQARDDFGQLYGTRWDKLNFSACIQQGSFGQRGEQGMFEALSNRLFNLLGAPASKTHYIHFRVIDEPHEDGLLNAAHLPLTTGGTQYDGDFWGLYLVLEQMDGRFLKEHALPDGNLYKMDGGNYETNNQGPTQPSDQSDLHWFLGSYRGGNELWWRQHVNLESYYGYYAAYQAVHHGDITSKNWFLYHHPHTDRWWQLPWDVDLTWTTYYGSNDPSDPFSRAGVFNHNAIDVEKKNRVRETLDLLFNPDQMNQLIDEYAAIINDPAGGLSIVDADRAMWDYHWVMGEGAYPKYLNRNASFKAGQGRFYAEAQQRGYDRSFEGMVQVMKDYVIERIGHLERKASDGAIPATPIIAYAGPPDHPTNALTFQTSAFSDPQGANTFGSMQWRIAEVTAGSQVIRPPGVSGFVIVPDGATWRYRKGRSEPSTIAGAWRKPYYDDSDWTLGEAPIGYGESFIATSLGDMRNGYSTVYLRKSFGVADLDAFDRLILEVKYDDGLIVWINGQFAYLDNVADDELPHTATAESAIENTSFVRRDLGDADALLAEGVNVITVQLLNASIGGSSDCFFDARLVGEKPAGGDDEPPNAPRLYRRQPGRYEIDAVWTSPEITAFKSEATIPAAGLRPGRTYRVRCRVTDNTGRASHWSTPEQFVAGEPMAAGIVADLRITEVMYNPPEPILGADADNDEFEFIELKNIGDETLDLTTVSLADGVIFDFAAGDVRTLGPGAFVLVVRNRTAFESRYGSAVADRVAGQYEGRLANDGENVLLIDHWNGTLAEFAYGDDRCWPLAADGGGHSLVPLPEAVPDEPAGSLDYPGNWRPSMYIGGSPGADDPSPAPSLLINEFLASPADDMGDSSEEWIELYNPTPTDIRLAGWYLSDDVGDPTRWALPDVWIPAGACIAFEDADFGLNRDGEQVVLSYLPGSDEDRIVDAIRFAAQETGVSLGRYPDGSAYWFRLSPSRETANVGPVAGLAMDEIMYHPVDVNDEYIELYNPTNEPIALDGPEGPWRLDGAVTYRFAPGRSVPAGGRLVIVGFDPVIDLSRGAAFAAAYGAGQLTADVDMVGPWSGSLSNRGERISLQKPQPGRPDGDAVVWAVVDEVVYGDVAPWPPQADGLGDALQRISADAAASGLDPANWRAAPPTPGRARRE